MTLREGDFYRADVADRARSFASADILIGHNVIFYDIPVLEKFTTPAFCTDS